MLRPFGGSYGGKRNGRKSSFSVGKLKLETRVKRKKHSEREGKTELGLLCRSRRRSVERGDQKEGGEKDQSHH